MCVATGAEVCGFPLVHNVSRFGAVFQMFAGKAGIRAAEEKSFDSTPSALTLKWFVPVNFGGRLPYIHRTYVEAMDLLIPYGGQRFAWDTNKASMNLHKHGIAFEKA
jgi:hypothetical protein